MARRFYYGWVITGASALGIACSFSVLVITITSIFAAPLEQEFHWSAPDVFLGLTVTGLAGLLSAPPIGALCDRFGVRRVVLISFVIEVLLLFSFSLMQGSLWGYWARYATLALLCMGSTQVAFSRVLSTWFNRRLGLALGIALAGVGAGGFMWTLLIQKLIDLYGWRIAYRGIALIVAFITLPLLALLLRETPASMGLHVDGEPEASSDDRAMDRTRGMTLGEASRTRQYWLMGITFLLVGGALQGAQVNVIPILRGRGDTAQFAALVQGFMSLTVIVGRLSSGYLLDRVFAPRVAQSYLLAPIVGIGALALGTAGYSGLMSAVCIGLAVGGETDIIAFLVRRYFGLKQYSRIYGTFFSFFGAGSALGPYLVSWGAKVAAGGYGTVLWYNVGTLAVAISLLFAFQRYTRDAT